MIVLIKMMGKKDIPALSMDASPAKLENINSGYAIGYLPLSRHIGIRGEP